MKQDAVNGHHLPKDPLQRRSARARRLIFALLAGMACIASTGSWAAQARAAKKTTKQEQAQQELLATQEAAVAALKEEFEKRLIVQALKENSGNQTKAAEILGIDRKTLREKMRRIAKAEQ